MLHEAKDPCEDAIAAQLRDLLGKRLDYMGQDEGGFFDAAQNARIVLAAEQYYRVMYQGSTESWNLRDRHMFDTLQAVLRHRGEGAKAVVWAHNSHVGNAAATAMGWAGEFNIGELCRTAFGHAAALVGFSTDRGRVAAASGWGGPVRSRTSARCSATPACPRRSPIGAARTGRSCARPWPSRGWSAPSA